MQTLQFPTGNELNFSVNHRNNSTPCRLSSVLINQHSGTPFFPDLFPEYEGFLPAEQCLWAVGIRGEDYRGIPFARAVLYNVDQDGFGLVFHADLDFRNVDNFEEGRFKLGRRDGVMGSVPPAKLAALNWAIGALLGATAPGTYDVEPGFLGDLIRRPIPRKDYALERLAGSCADMFQRHCTLLTNSESYLKLETPRLIPLIDRNRLPDDQEEVDKLPVSTFEITPEAFRSYAMNRFALGLRRPEGEFKEIKAKFALQFKIAQDLLDKKNRLAQHSHLERAIELSKKDALRHLASLRLPEDELPASMENLAMAINSLKSFSRQRNEQNRIVMYRPGTPVVDDSRSELDLKDKQSSLFHKPMFRAVLGVPVQIIDNVMSTGLLPDDGGKLENI